MDFRKVTCASMLELFILKRLCYFLISLIFSIIFLISLMTLTSLMTQH